MIDRSMKNEVLFVTGNIHKVKEASRILSKFQINVKMLDCEKVEIQSDSLVRIAKYAASLASMKLKKTIIVEDSGLFIKPLNGFPGPFSSYVFKTVGCGGVLQLLSGKADRSAVFKCAVAFCSPKSHPVVFEGKTYGSISLSVKGSGGFGFDPIFIPKKGDGRTFAEMPPENKDRLSHRGAAFKGFGEWYAKH
ncbi:MAG: XTP/dITP diphosphatase [Candidatus Methanomethyliaceae archaeon]|nr:XTP/dITP diphosphatase [Candidatus Methanomethyliaceae archaeon]